MLCSYTRAPALCSKCLNNTPILCLQNLMIKHILVFISAEACSIVLIKLLYPKLCRHVLAILPDTGLYVKKIVGGGANLGYLKKMDGGAWEDNGGAWEDDV